MFPDGGVNTLSRQPFEPSILFRYETGWGGRIIPAMNTTISDSVLRIAGYPDLTADYAVQFREQACAALAGQISVEVDLSQTTTMDCTGVGALIAIRNLTRARQGGVRLLRPTPAVQRVFKILHVADLFEIVNVPPPVVPRFASADAPALDAPSSAG